MVVYGVLSTSGLNLPDCFFTICTNPGLREREGREISGMYLQLQTGHEEKVLHWDSGQSLEQASQRTGHD